MPTAYLITCGTSAFNALFKGKEFEKSTVEDIQKKTGKSFDEFLQALLCGYPEGKSPSAEISTLMNLKPKPIKQDEFVLFSTNSNDSRLSCEVVRSILLRDGFQNVRSIETKRLSGAKNDLLPGLRELANTLISNCREYKSNGLKVEFIVTGGYKAMTALASAVAMLLGCKAHYRYEDGEVGNIGVLPLALNLSGLPESLFTVLAQEGSFSRKELVKMLDNREDLIDMYFQKTESKYERSPVTTLITQRGSDIPVCSDAPVPISCAEEGKSHNYPEWGKLSNYKCIPCKKTIELLEAASRAISPYAAEVFLSEFNMQLGLPHISYFCCVDQRVRLKLRVPSHTVILSIKPKQDCIGKLDDLCKLLWKA